MTVKTAKVTGRRKLAFASFAEMLADADRLSSGPVKTLGNWSAGQVFRHLALTYTASIDGFTIKFPWYLRWTGKVFKKKLLSMPMPAGFQLPDHSGEALQPAETTTTEEGLGDLKAAVGRLEREENRAQHPMLGEMTREQWNRLHLAHADLHLSFLVPQ